jgi:hypothetical protein
MRITIISLLACLVLGFQYPDSVSSVSWLSAATHDFGAIKHNQPVRHEFRFRNISGKPLVIDNVRTSCGCTVPDWDAAAVAPDSIGIIGVEYDARDVGYFLKKIKVYFHGQRKPELLYLEGDVSP